MQFVIINCTVSAQRLKYTWHTHFTLIISCWQSSTGGRKSEYLHQFSSQSSTSSRTSQTCICPVDRHQLVVEHRSTCMRWYQSTLQRCVFKFKSQELLDKVIYARWKPGGTMLKNDKIATMTNWRIWSGTVESQTILDPYLLQTQSLQQLL